MLYKHTVIASSLLGLVIIGSGFVPETFTLSAAAPSAEVASVSKISAVTFASSTLSEPVREVEDEEESEEEFLVEEEERLVPDRKAEKRTSVYKVPFFSQFSDISAPEWKKVSCGIASLAMLIDFYEPNKQVTADSLLKEGIAAHAYADDAGWSHAGLIGLSRKYGLDGESHDLGGSSMDSAFAVLKDELKEGPVMASVHYTFDPKNPIPHLVVVNGVSDGKVYYNDPSESGAGGSVSIAQFQSAWKKRYIDIRPVS